MANYNHRKMAEFKLLPILMGRGHIVSLPTDFCAPYDLIDDSGKVLHKIQVKTSESEPKRDGSYSVDIRHGGSGERAYSPGAVHFFAIHIPSKEAWYLIPADVLGHRAVTVAPDKAWDRYATYRDNWEQLDATKQLAA